MKRNKDEEANSKRKERDNSKGKRTEDKPPSPASKNGDDAREEDSDDEDDFKFQGEVSAPVDSIYDMEAILNRDNIDIEKWSLPLVTTDEDQLKDVDNKIFDLFSSINLKTKSIKN